MLAQGHMCIALSEADTEAAAYAGGRLDVSATDCQRWKPGSNAKKTFLAL